MAYRSKARRERQTLIPEGVKTDTGSKDQLLCRLEQENTIYAAAMEKFERSKAEMDALRANFSLLYERSPLGYMTTDKQGRVYDANESVSKLLGYDKAKMAHRPLKFLVHPEDIKALLNHLWRCETENDARVVTNLRLRTKARESVSVQLVSLRFMVVNERQMFLTVVIDVTELEKRARALAETSEFADAIVQTVRHPLAVLDRDLRIISVNRAFTDFFHRPMDFIRGRVFEVLLNMWWSGNMLRNELEKVLIRNQPLEDYRVEVEPPDLGPRILLVSARPLYQKVEMPQRLLVALEDITEQEMARQELRKLNADLEQRVAARTNALQKSNEQMESFCYSIAHDLRAPLRSMTGFSTILVEDYARNLPPEAQDYATRIARSAERMDRLIRDLLNYGRLNTIDLEIQDVNLDETFRTALQEQEAEIKERNAKIAKKGILPLVRGHPLMLQTILTNLFSNAMKFVAPGVQPVIQVTAETTNSLVRVWVRDNGIGIAPENRNKIFGVFQRLHTIEKYPGTGIGLAIVRRGIERMGGRVGVESEVGKGSRFWLELPRVRANGEVPPRDS